MVITFIKQLISWQS